MSDNYALAVVWLAVFAFLIGEMSRRVALSGYVAVMAYFAFEAAVSYGGQSVAGAATFATLAIVLMFAPSFFGRFVGVFH